ncbi:MAG TPA: GNAT family N-acetyltransferase [Patescibacteria group bacterium]|nr:GNAT family N-acetyltransferase [Patescibacteria group bacterium]
MTEQSTVQHEDDQLVNLYDQPELHEVQVREDVILRPMQDSDAQEILAILNADPSIREQVTVASRMHNEEDVRREVASYQADGSVIRYVIEQEGKCVGLVSFWRDTGFFGQEAQPHKFGFGYFLNPTERGKGLVTDSVRALMETAQASFRVDSFIAFCEDANQESVAILLKLGLEPTEVTYPEPAHAWLERMYEKRITDDR